MPEKLNRFKMIITSSKLEHDKLNNLHLPDGTLSYNFYNPG